MDMIDKFLVANGDVKLMFYYQELKQLAQEGKSQKVDHPDICFLILSVTNYALEYWHFKNLRKRSTV